MKYKTYDGTEYSTREVFDEIQKKILDKWENDKLFTDTPSPITIKYAETLKWQLWNIYGIVNDIIIERKIRGKKQ